MFTYGVGDANEDEFVELVNVSNSNTQKILHPNTTDEVGDIDKAKDIAKKLKNDKDFYNECSKETQYRFEEFYKEEKFFSHIERIITSLR